jgi:hypothetical protein
MRLRAHLSVPDLSSPASCCRFAPSLASIDGCGVHATHRPGACREYGLSEACAPSLECVSVRTTPSFRPPRVRSAGAPRKGVRGPRSHPLTSRGRMKQPLNLGPWGRFSETWHSSWSASDLHKKRPVLQVGLVLVVGSAAKLDVVHAVRSAPRVWDAMVELNLPALLHPRPTRHFNIGEPPDASTLV